MFILVYIKLKLGYVMYFMPTNHMYNKRFHAKILIFAHFVANYRSNSALATDFPRYVLSRHVFIFSQMAIKIHIVTQEMKGFQMIPHKPGLDKNPSGSGRTDSKWAWLGA